MSVFTPSIEFTSDYPAIEPSLKLDFANARALDPRITFRRDSIATYVDKDGLIKTASNGEPRFDHDPATGESLGLLIEESRINLIPNGDQIGGPGWSNPGNNTSNLTTNNLSPTGENVASTWSGPGYYEIISGTTDGTTYMMSVYAKQKDAGDGGFASLQLGSDTSLFGGGSDRADASFNLATGAVTSTQPGVVSAGSEDVGNGWRRYYVSGVKSGAADIAVIVYCGNHFNGASLYAWGAQLEAGSFPTSYIPTSGSTATREVDVATISGESFNSFFNPSEGTVICKYKKDHWPIAAGNDITYERIWEIGDGTDTSNLNIFNDPTITSGNIIRYRVRTSGTNSFGPQNASTGSNQTPTVALGYAKDNFALAIDGALVDTDTSGDLPAVDRLHIGGRYGGDSTDRFNNTISKLIYYPKRLTNVQLQTLTQ